MGKLRQTIKEEVDNLRFQKLTKMVSVYLMSRGVTEFDYSDDRQLGMITKLLHSSGLSWKDGELMDKIMGAFQTSKTTNYDDESFNRNPVEKAFDVEVTVSWSGYGVDTYEGQIYGYTEYDVAKGITDEGTYNELDMTDRDFRNYESDDIDYQINPIISPLEETTLIKESNETVDFYLKYYSDLIPSNHKIIKEGNQIIITITE